MAREVAVRADVRINPLLGPLCHLLRLILQMMLWGNGGAKMDLLQKTTSSIEEEAAC